MCVDKRGTATALGAIGYRLKPLIGDRLEASIATMNRPRLTRWLRITWTALFGIAAVLLCVLWVRSYWVGDRVHAVDTPDAPTAKVVGPSKDENKKFIHGKDAEEIAIIYTMHETDVPREQLDAEIFSKDDNWVVRVKMVPGFPGAIWLLTIDESGKVLNFDGGL